MATILYWPIQYSYLMTHKGHFFNSTDNTILVSTPNFSPFFPFVMGRIFTFLERVCMVEWVKLPNKQQNLNFYEGKEFQLPPKINTSPQSLFMSPNTTYTFTIYLGKLQIWLQMNGKVYAIDYIKYQWVI